LETSNPDSVPPSSFVTDEGITGFIEAFFLSPDWGSLIVLIFIIFFFLICSALISGSEVSLFSMGNTQLTTIRESDDRKDKEITNLLLKPKYLLATILIANNFFNILVVILFSSLTLMLFNMVAYPKVGFFIEVVLVTFVLVLLGEIMPKVYANQNALKFSRIMAYPLMILGKILFPLSYLLVSATKFIDKRITKKGHDLSVDELNHAIDLTSDDVEKDEDKDILKGIVRFGNIPVKQIMRSRVDITSFDISSDFKTIVKEIVDAGYSRVPVYDETIDNVKGILFIKDLLPYLGEDIDVNWQNLVRNAFFVPESKKIDDLLKEFQLKRMHMAIVVDEYGGTSGIVTLEDILEEIVGEINDELDDLADDLKYSKLDDANYVFDAKVSINDLFKIMNLDENPFDKVRGEADTLGGLILEIAGKIPKLREELYYDIFKFKVESVDKRRIKRVKITILDEPVNPDLQMDKEEN
jgi:putative hemolysin